MGRRAAVVAVVVLALSVVIGSGAFTSTTLDRSATLEVVGDAENFLGLASHSGPNGVYAYDSAGKLVLDFGGGNPNVGGSGPISGATGQAADAVTTVEDVFNVTNQGTQVVRVWVDDGSEAVEFTTTTGGHGSIDGEANAITVVPGQTVEVGLSVDSAGAAVGDVLLDGITINAAAEGAEAPDPGPGPGPGPAPAPTPERTPSILVGATDSFTLTTGKAYILTSLVSGTASLADADATLTGEGIGSATGRSVAVAGDINGDDETDYVVGAPLDSEFDSAAGAAYVVYGPVSGRVSLTDADVKLVGDEADDRAGSWVAGVGDVNGDGFDDVVVGAPRNDVIGSDEGAAYLVYGSASLGGKVSLGNADATFLGEEPGDLAGSSVAGAGDVNGDGFADLLVGAPGHDDLTSDEGAAYLIYGSASLSGTSSLAGADAKFLGVGEFDNAGTRVAGAGDIDGDGLDDVLIGAPFNDNAGGTSAGAAYVVLGGAGADAPAGTTSLGTADVTLLGEAGEDWAGASIAGAGDVDGDGFDDILIGAPRNDAAGSDAGAAYLVYGSPSLASTVALTNADLTITGEAPLSGAAVVAGAGDMNDDGFDDLLVGAPNYDKSTQPTADDIGAVYLFYGGSLSGTVSAAAADAKLLGESADEPAGVSVDGGA